MKLSIIVPVLNEAEVIETTLAALYSMRERGHEVIVVDGGSADGTLDIAAPLSDRILQSKRGRAVQMHTGAMCANGDVLWFVHADTLVPEDADLSILAALNTDVKKSGQWGRFNVRLSGTKPALRIVEYLMNLRSQITGIATGDQGIFVRRDLYKQLGGFPDQALMEDIEFSKRLKRISKPVCLNTVLETSSRRWERRGVLKTVILMWLLRAAYSAGVSARRLAYYYE